MKTFQLQITVVPRITDEYPDGYEPEIEEINGLIQHALNVFTALLPKDDLARDSKFKVWGKMTEDISESEGEFSDKEVVEKIHLDSERGHNEIS